MGAAADMSMSMKWIYFVLLSFPFAEPAADENNQFCMHSFIDSVAFIGYRNQPSSVVVVCKIQYKWENAKEIKKFYCMLCIVAGRR